MQLVLTHKRGDTFTAVLEYQPEGVPTSLTGATVQSALRWYDPPGSYVLTVTLADQIATPGRVTISAPYADTEAWPVGDALADIQVTIAGVRTSSEDFVVRVLQDQT